MGPRFAACLPSSEPLKSGTQKAGGARRSRAGPAEHLSHASGPAVASQGVVVTTARIAIVIAALASSALAAAQWPSYPTPDVPRDAKGAPVLTGPAPRMADGK